MKIMSFVFQPLIKTIIKHPDIMKSKVFLKMMVIFPAKITQNYDKQVVNRVEDYHLPLEKGLSRILSKPQKILDLCTGTGFAAFKAAEVFPYAVIDAIDHSSGMVDIAQKKKLTKGVNNVYFKKGSAIELDYASDEFDLIISSNAPVYLSEASRVLKPGGLLLVTYSFWGKAFVNSKLEIVEYLKKNNLKLVEIKDIGNGVYVLGEK